MKKINKSLALILSLGTIVGMTACGSRGSGFNMNETESDITEITVLAGDMDTYQTDGVDKNTPVYLALTYMHKQA